jgi:MFS family permease
VSRSRLPRSVWLLGWVSLATDAATEAIYPLVPFFLTQVLGAGAISLGLVEGAAEAVNSVLKLVTGRLADRAREKRPLVLLGYGISSAVRPLIAIATGWAQVLGIRVLDRVGKGIRSAPRDALLASASTPEIRGRVYGFHQGMDNLGAVLGPVLATIFLFAFPGQYRRLFALTIIPGAIATALIFFIREHDNRVERAGTAGEAGREPHPPDPPLPPAFSRFMWVLVLFSLGNSTDAFLLLKLTDAAGSARFVPLMWAGLNAVKAVVSMIGGSWSDRIGRRTVIATGWLIYAVVYAGFAFTSSLAALLGWFVVYGFYFGFAEGTEKALVADLAPPSRRGYAFGIYNAIVGFGALGASILFGLIWTAFGAPAAFGLGAALSLIATTLLFAIV